MDSHREASSQKSSRDRSSGKDIRVSKRLSWMLRHGATEQGLDMDDAGFVSLHQLLSKRGFGEVTVEDIQRIVAQDKKQRYTLSEDPSGALCIRANQGHSAGVANKINPDELLYRLREADLSENFTCVHGTSLKAWRQIEQNGLSRMRRQMIHCAVGLPGENGVISGMRSSCTVLIYVDIRTAIADGVPFFRSNNNVLLTPGIDETGTLPVRYLNKVVRRDTGETLNIHSNPSQS